MTDRHANQLNRIHSILRQIAVSEEVQGDLDAAEMLMYASRGVARILDVIDVQHREAMASQGVSSGLPS